MKLCMINILSNLFIFRFQGLEAIFINLIGELS